MIIENQSFIMRWNPSNREWYVGKGHTFTKWFDEFVVNAEELAVGSPVIILSICDNCDKQFEQKYSRYYKNQSDVCTECSPSRLSNEISKETVVVRKNNTSQVLDLKVGEEKIIIKKCEICDLYKDIKCYSSISVVGKRMNQKPHCKQCESDNNIKIKDEDYISISSITQTSRNRNLVVDIDKKSYLEMINSFKGKCALTDDQIFITEHFIPVSWGHGGTYIGNIYPLKASLNSSKSNMNPFKWYKSKMSNTVSIKTWNKLIKYLADANNMSVREFKEFVYWCEANKREKSKSNVESNAIVNSIELWRESKESLI